MTSQFKKDFHQWYHALMYDQHNGNHTQNDMQTAFHFGFNTGLQVLYNEMKFLGDTLEEIQTDYYREKKETNV